MGSKHQFFGWARTTKLLGGLKPPTFLLGLNHQPFGWAQTTNFSGRLKPPTERSPLQVHQVVTHPSTAGGHQSKYTRWSVVTHPSTPGGHSCHDHSCLRDGDYRSLYQLKITDTRRALSGCSTKRLVRTYSGRGETRERGSTGT